MKQFENAGMPECGNAGMWECTTVALVGREKEEGHSSQLNSRARLEERLSDRTFVIDRKLFFLSTIFMIEDK